MKRYTPFQRTLFAFLAAFLLFFLLCWLSLPGGPSVPELAWSALKPSLLIGGIAWVATSISDLRYQVDALRYQVEALRSELQRLKTKE